MNSNTEGKIGLVLSGGGAKGAYQVGVMRALCEHYIPIHAISGASIGALNGAVLAAAPDLKTGTERLEKMWQQIGEINPLKFDTEDPKKWMQAAVYFSVLVSAGLHFATPITAATLTLSTIVKSSSFINLCKSIGINLAVFQSALQDDVALLSDEPLYEMMNDYLDMAQLKKSLPLYISVFKKQNNIQDFAGILGAELLGIENRPSEFLRIQDLPDELQKDTLLASAAIPLLFKPKKDADGRSMTDGGQGGWIKSQGNTPITPLINDARCDYVIVSHLSNGSLWNRHDFPETTCIEIRPNPALDLGFTKMFDFKKDSIARLIDYGYQDTMRILGEIKEMLDLIQDKRNAMREVEVNLAKHDELNKEMDRAMDRLAKSMDKRKQ